MVKKVLLGIVAFLVLATGVFLVVVALQPAEYSISRSTTIDAPPDVVFAQLNDFHKWDDWSPWSKLDPNATTTFSGPSSGEGAKFAWSGNSEVGEGSMTILESQPPRLVRIRLEFVRPFEDVATTELALTGRTEPEQTHLTWTMSGRNNFVGKVFCIFMDMDAMLGKDFEKGLASIKAIAEAEAADADPEPAAETAADAAG